MVRAVRDAGQFCVAGESGVRRWRGRGGKAAGEEEPVLNHMKELLEDFE